MRPRKPSAVLVGAAAVAALTIGTAGLTPSAHALPAAAPVASDVALTGPHGARGIGDQYFPLDGNGGYDVQHYDIDDRYQISEKLLKGTTTLTAVARQDLTRFDLDLVLTADSVTVNGRKAKFHSGAHELVVTPAHALASGDDFTVVVTYHGNPDEISFDGEAPWYASDQEAMATNEPHIAPWWFAANDHPTDKATYDVTVRVPAGNQVLSNGTLVSHRTHGNLTAWHWAEDSPMASYLAFFAAGRFQIKSGVEGGLPYTVAVSKLLSAQQRAVAMKLMLRIPGFVHWLETQFGAYPFSSTGGVVTGLDRSFSLENQTRPTFYYFGGDQGAQSTVVHELAHQWFGDGVSVHRWRDIWLNEGFATFAQWLYEEAHGGEDGQHRLLRDYDSISAGDPFWTLPIGDPGAQNIFDGAVYTRGAMTLQALRHRIGEAKFANLLPEWVNQQTGGTGSIEQFEALAADVSGEDLTGFFQHWLFDPSKPAKTAENGLV